MFDLLEMLKNYGVIGVLFITAPLAILGLLLTIYFQWWRNRKSFSYEVLASTNLFSVNPNVKHRIEFLFDGKTVKDVQLVIIEFQNNGYLPIEDKDFATPITIDFGDMSEILSVDNISNVPEDMQVDFSFAKSKIEIQPLLLNRKDSIQLQILLSKLFKYDFKVRGRIKGVVHINDKKIPVNFFGFLLTNRAFGLFISVPCVLLSVSTIMLFFDITWITNFFIWSIVFCGSTYIVFDIYKSRKESRLPNF